MSEEIDKLARRLINPNLLAICDYSDLKERIKALFTLRNIRTKESLSAISLALYDPSELLAHEAAYCLGQMKAAEAIGAINDVSSLDILEAYAKDSSPEVADTCELAKHRIMYYMDISDPGVDTVYGSVDPAPAYASEDIELLKHALIDEENELFDRYRAMFALRNIGTDQSAEALLYGFYSSNALFKHEVAFVLGQMRKPCTVDALIEVVKNPAEHPMVRHEAAEALGNIATPEAVEFLKTCLQDPVRIVRESAYVALDIADYQNSNQMEYV